MSLFFKGGIKDLKIYADLALLSVEGDEQVGRVTRLHSAAIGYSSVIFGNIYGEIEMIDTWREVWQNLEKDNFLPQKLVIFKASYTQKILTKKYSLWMPILINLQWFILLYKWIYFVKFQMLNRSCPTFYESDINNYILNTNIVKRASDWFLLSCNMPRYMYNPVFCFGRFNFILIKMELIKALNIWGLQTCLQVHWICFTNAIYLRFKIYCMFLLCCNHKRYKCLIAV